MKSRLVVLMLLILFLPHFTKASVVTDSCDGLCYDSNLDINVGDKLNWLVIEHLKNGSPVDYGIDSNGPLTISMELIKEIKGLSYFDVNLRRDDYFNTTLTISGNDIDGNINDFIELFGDTGYYWIEPTQMINDSIVVNRFIEAIDNNPNGTIFTEGVLWNVTQQRFHSIDNENYYLNYEVRLIRNNDSVIVYTESRDMSYSMQTGQLLHVAYSLEDIKREAVEEWINYSYIINAEPTIVPEANTKLINFPFFALITTVILITLQIQFSRKNHY